MLYSGPSIRMSSRQYTFGRLLERSRILSGQDAARYDMRTLISFIKNEWVTGSINAGFSLSGNGREAMMAFGHSNIERTSTLKIPEFVLSYRGRRTRRAH